MSASRTYTSGLMRFAALFFHSTVARSKRDLGVPRATTIAAAKEIRTRVIQPASRRVYLCGGFLRTQQV